MALNDRESEQDLSSHSSESEPFLDGKIDYTQQTNGDDAVFQQPKWALNTLSRLGPNSGLVQRLWTSALLTPSLIALLALILGVYLGHLFTSSRAISISLVKCTRPPPPSWSPSQKPLKKPKGVKVVAVIFFGRRAFADILDCYLRKNLAVNGGFLDEVHFIMHRTEVEDRQWLRNLIRRDKDELKDRYKMMKVTKEIKQMDTFRYNAYWGTFFNDPDTIYFKLDDDIVFIDDAAIPRMTYNVLAHPEAHSIQANVINNMRTHWFHLRTGAVLPYVPEAGSPSSSSTNAWRASELPQYEGDLLHGSKENFRTLKPPAENHRWLPLDPNPRNMQLTPFDKPLPTPDFECGGRRKQFSWTNEAQVHYSFLDNLENNRLSRYDFGNNEGIFNLYYGRYNINFMAIRGSTNNLLPFWKKGKLHGWSDEPSLTTKVPKLLSMPVLVDTQAIVSHYSFHQMKEELLTTDVLSRYRAYANEKVCTRQNQKKAFGREAEKTPLDPQDDDDSEHDDYDDQQ